MNQSKKITEGALLTAIYIVLLLIIVFIPIIQLIGLFVLPVPFIVYAAKHGFKSGLLMIIISAILTMIFATAVTLPLTLLAGVGGIAIGSGIYSKKNAYETWAQGTVGYIIAFVAIIALLQLVFSINIFNEIDVAMNESMELMRSILGQFNLLEDAKPSLELMESQLEMMKDMIPVGIAILSIIMAFLAQWVSYKVLNRVEGESLKFPAFKELNMPIAVIWIFFITIILSFMDLDQGSTLFTVFVNVEAICVFLLVIQGFSFVFFYMDHKNIHQSVPIIIVICTLFLPVILMFIIRILGIIDLGFSLKAKIRQQKS